jgi:hypothetical protein
MPEHIHAASCRKFRDLVIVDRRFAVRLVSYRSLAEWIAVQKLDSITLY